MKNTIQYFFNFFIQISAFISHYHRVKRGIMEFFRKCTVPEAKPPAGKEVVNHTIASDDPEPAGKKRGRRLPAPPPGFFYAVSLI